MSMTQHAHVVSLEQKHANLEAMINDEAHRPHPDDLKLAYLKREKLRIKEEMSRFEMT